MVAFAFLLRFIYLCLMLNQMPASDLLKLAPDTIQYVNIGSGIAGVGGGDEAAIIMFGPGYGAFLGVVFLVFGVYALPVLLLQIALSTLGCLLLYKLAKELFDSKTVGLVAGYLAATSFTSISLATYILSDCLYFVLFLSGNLLFLLGMTHQRRRHFIWSGILIGTSILVRSIGQFWPLIMLGLIIIWPMAKRTTGWWRAHGALLKTAGLAPLIALIITGGWMARNYVRYSVPMMAFTTAGGPANIAARALSRIENRDIDSIQTAWGEEYKRRHGIIDLSKLDRYMLSSQAARRTLLQHPWPVLQAYGDLIWRNMTSVNQLYQSQLPRCRIVMLNNIDAIMSVLPKSYVVLLFISGLLMLLWKRQWQAGLLLAAIFVYFALLVGFTLWQGSRLFYPAQIAWSIVIAYFLTTAFQLTRKKIVQ